MSNPPDTLTKYCSAETAIKMLQSQSLRWSAPYLFSDPFELSHKSPLCFDPQLLLENVIRSACGLLFARDEPRGTSPLSTAIRRWRDEERFASPEEAEDVLRELMARMVDQKQEEIDETMNNWRLYTRHLRICNFSEKPDNLTCWEYFADRHHGIALKFHCTEGKDIIDPQQVIYSPNRPEVMGLKEQVDAILHNQSLKPEPYFQEKLLFKSPLNKNEREWRCFYSTGIEDKTKNIDENDWHEDRVFDERSLSSVYFGLHTPVATKKIIIKLVKKKYPHVKVFQASTVNEKYDLSFSRITIT